MSVEENLKSMIESKFDNIKSFSEEIELPYTTVRSILQRGLLNAKVENVIKIADGLNMKAEDLLRGKPNGEQNIIGLYNQLEKKRQKKVYNFAEHQLKEQENKVVPLVGATAANPQVLAYADPVYDTTVNTNVPDSADCALVVHGNSMEPDYMDGSIVFYKRQNTVENGELAIIDIDGDGVTFKKVIFDYDSQQVILRSLNAAYDDRVLKKEEYKIVGKVVK